MAQTTNVLFQPLTIGSLIVAGRVFKTATSETRASPEGFVTDELLEFYRPLAQAQTPLIITGNMHVSRDGQSTPRMCGIDHDDKLPGLVRLTDMVHTHGSRIIAQLNHCGRQVLPAAMGLREAVSASDVTEKVMGTKPRPLSVAEIAQIVMSFADAAGRAQRAGFDGVQIHAAHGYLISQFLTPYTNRRGDQYGGGLDNRMRLLVEVYQAIRERVGAAFPIIVKLNGSDYLPLRRGLKTQELVAVAQRLEALGVDALEISVGHYESGMPVVRGRFWRFFPAMLRLGSGTQLPWARRAVFALFWPLAALAFNLLWPPREGFNLHYARKFKAALRIPVICVGGFYTRAEMERTLRAGWCDALACGRAMIADPFLYRHLRDNTVGPRCVYCNACVGRIGGLPVDCYHPDVRREKDAMLAAPPV